MQLNEDTYEYMKKASFQIEGIACALSVYIENTIDTVKKYHYKVYNELLNEIRNKHIDAIIQIKEIFEGARDSIENIAIRISASGSAKNVLLDELDVFEDCLSRLVIHCKNIQECNSNTENPCIPDANDEIYKCFSEYKYLISDYRLEKPTDDDIVSTVIYSFYEAAVNIYKNLFSEYDKMMDRLGVELQERRETLAGVEQGKALGIVKKGTLAGNIAKATAVGAVGIIGGIQKGEAFTAIGAGIGLIAKISEELENVSPKKSLAQKALKRVETLSKSMELINEIGIKEASGFDDNTMGAVNLIGALIGVSPLKLHQLNKEGKLDLMVATAGFTTATVSCVGTAISGKPFAALAKLPKVADKGMNLIESMSKYYGEKDVHNLPKVIDNRIHNLTKTIKDHEHSVEEYKAKLIRGIPVRKPKAPPWMRVHSGISFISGRIDNLNDLVGGS